MPEPIRQRAAVRLFPIHNDPARSLDTRPHLTGTLEVWPGTRPSLGIDFVKEQHLAIDASGPHFTEAGKLLPDDICPMFTQTEVCIPPRTVRRLTVNPRAASGLKCPPGTTGVVSSDTDEYGIWDAATTVQDDCTVDIVFANTARTEIKLHPLTPIGYLQLIDPTEGRNSTRVFWRRYSGTQPGSLRSRPEEPSPSQPRRS